MEIREALTRVALKHYLIAAALLLLQSSSKLKTAKQGCSRVLKELLTTMETQKANMELAASRKEVVRRVTKEDMRMLRHANKERKEEIQHSAYYVGYRLLWILGLFLKGRKFPTGKLEATQYKLQVFNIVDFVTDHENLAALLDFDSESFFESMVRLFTHEPWNFITHTGNYKFEFQKKAREGTPQQEAEPLCNVPIAH